tara:strand:- start:290 stop:493 length:204 start_codon:yes stop_codon:yes gene_type:complete
MEVKKGDLLFLGTKVSGSWFISLEDLEDIETWNKVWVLTERGNTTRMFPADLRNLSYENRRRKKNEV